MVDFYRHKDATKMVRVPDRLPPDAGEIITGSLRAALGT
jgi:aspartyl/asparaginyl-tRNA synthetase